MNVDVVIDVLPQNRKAVEVFLDAQTQWRVAGFGQFLGLDYAGVHATMQMTRVKRTRDTFRRVRVIENAALQEMKRRQQFRRK